MWQNCIFKDNIEMWVLKTFILKNMTPFYLGICQIQLLGEEICGKNFIFQDNIEVWVLKTFLSKNDLLSLELFKSDYLEWRYQVKTAFSKITWECGYTKHVSKM